MQAIRPMQQFHGAHHKNAAHCALKMDAMEFKAHTPRLDGICIASCDSDFTDIAHDILNVESPGAFIERAETLPYKKLRKGMKLAPKGRAF